MLSYHSLEDRPVKQCFQRLSQEGTLENSYQKCYPGFGRGGCGQSARAQRKNARSREARSRPARDAAQESVAAMSEFYTVKQIDNSRLVRPMAPNRIRECARLVFLGGMIALCALLYAWQHFETIQLRYTLESLRSEHSQAAELNQQLKLEVAGLRSPGRIDIIARRQLGLTAPVPGQVAPMDLPPNAVMAEARPSGAQAGQQ